MVKAKSKAGIKGMRKKGSGWHKKMMGLDQKKRKSLARKRGYAGGLYAKDLKRKQRYSPNPKLLTAPLQSKSTKLPIQFNIIVPSTKKGDKKLTTRAFNKRVETIAKTMSKEFGGETSIKGVGGYINKKGKLVKEKVMIVESSMKKEDYLKNKKELEKLIKIKKKEWGQESIGFNLEEDFYIYPKFD